MSANAPTPIVFYSWQSDLPSKTNRGLIEEALEKACKDVNAALQLAIRVDSDVQGESGAPDIAATILKKIEDAAVVVADVSIIGAAVVQGSAPPKQRLVPNPNVMVEVGYAKKALGPERVIMVCNTAFGAVEELPFDIKGKYVVSYAYSNATDDKPAAARSDLRSRLKMAITSALSHASTSGRHRHIAEAYQEVSLDCHWWKTQYFQFGMPAEDGTQYTDIWDRLLVENHRYSDDAYRQYSGLFVNGLQRVRERLDRALTLFGDVFPAEFRLAVLQANRALEDEQVGYRILKHIEATQEQRDNFLNLRFTQVFRILRDLSRDADARRAALVVSR